MPIFRTGKTVLHQGNENTVSRWNDIYVQEFKNSTTNIIDQ